MVANTVQAVLDEARLDLGDASTNPQTGSAITPRYPEADLLKFANAGMAKALMLRPDLKFGSYTTAWTDLAATSSFPLPIEYRDAIVSYIVHRNQAGDDAFANSQKADQGLIKYVRELGLGG
jgi:hypothetical protein